MTEDQLFEFIEPPLRGAGAVAEAGEVYSQPPLEILRYYRRPVRVHWLPLIGQGLSVVALTRQPRNIICNKGSYLKYLSHLRLAANTRFPPWGTGRGLVLGLTLVVLTSEPIGPEDDQVLADVLTGLKRSRAVVLGAIRINLGQEAVSFALTSSPGGMFPEPGLLADLASSRFRRFVPLLGS